MRSYLAIVLAVIAYTYVDQVAASNEELMSIYGMQRLLVSADSDSKLELLLAHRADPDFDFVRIPASRDEPVDVLVTAERLDGFKRELTKNQVRFEVVVEDMSELVREQAGTRAKRSTSANIYDGFLRYDQIANLVKLAPRYFPDFVSTINLGKSSEQRDILGLKFSRNCSSSQAAPKPAVFIDAGIHAREWLSPMTAIYTILELTKPENRYLFEDVDIYVVPLLNPDGYEFSHLNESTRLWRKTRSRQEGNCYGVDANRNFDIDWNGSRSNRRPCSMTYAGTKAFSEPETQALRDFLLKHRDSIKVYLSLHSYGNYLLYPWGHDDKKSPANENTLYCVAVQAVTALNKVRNTQYTIGNTAKVLYKASGGSDDWAMAKAGIELAYTMELPSRNYGFKPPRSELVPVGQETFEAIKVFAGFAKGDVCRDVRQQRPTVTTTTTKTTTRKGDSYVENDRYYWAS